MGFAEVLTLILIVLKLVGVISVSWFIVFLPLIIVYGLALALFLLGLIITTID